jgi:hypothetical protein
MIFSRFQDIANPITPRNRDPVQPRRHPRQRGITGLRFRAWKRSQLSSVTVSSLAAPRSGWDLSARCRLHWEDKSFHVVDCRQLRPADTLSGDETFVTALALALHLSEQVQRVSRCRQAQQSFFIDWGPAHRILDVLDHGWGSPPDVSYRVLKFVPRSGPYVSGKGIVQYAPAEIARCRDPFLS